MSHQLPEPKTLESYRQKLIRRWDKIQDQMQEMGNLYDKRLRRFASEISFLMTEEELGELFPENKDKKTIAEDKEVSEGDKKIADEIFFRKLSKIFATRVLAQPWKEKDVQFWAQGDAGMSARNWILSAFFSVDEKSIADQYNFCRKILALIRNTGVKSPEETKKGSKIVDGEPFSDQEVQNLNYKNFRDSFEKWIKVYEDYEELIFTDRFALNVESFANPKRYRTSLKGLHQVTESALAMLFSAEIKLTQLYPKYATGSSSLQVARMTPGQANYD